MNILLKHKFDSSLFPYVYLESYSEFSIKNKNQKVLYFYDENDNSIACSIWSNKFLNLLQPLYPPLNKFGTRIDNVDEELFLNKFIAFIQASHICDRISAPTNFAIFKTAPLTSKHADFGTYFIDLENNTEEELFLTIHSKHKNVIRNAKKNGVTIEYNTEKALIDFYELYLLTMQRSSMHFERFEYFKNEVTVLTNNIIYGVVYDGAIPLGGLFMPYTKFGAFYLFGASADKITINGAMNYLHWNTIKLLKKKGVKRYDFVGARLSDISNTKLHGIQQFKSRFGATLEKGYLWKLDISTFKCFMYDTLLLLKLVVKKQTNFIDIIDQELNKIKIPKKRIFINKFINKFTKKKQSVLKELRIFKKPFNKNHLITNLKNVGINSGDTILIHASLSKIGNVKGGAKTVIDALIEAVGEKGNVVMPSFSYINNSMLETVIDENYIFNPLNSPSVVGKISDTFRKLPGVIRSYHPTHSFCAFGPDAYFINNEHLEATTNFGRKTPFDKIIQLKGKVIGIGISLGPVTIYHCVEDFFSEKFKGTYFSDFYSIKMKINNEIIEKKIKVHDPDYHKVRIDKDKIIENWFRNYLLNKQILHEGDFGGGNIWWMDVQALFDELIELNKKGITIYSVPKS